jgi:peroxiredoxin
MPQEPLSIGHIAPDFTLSSKRADGPQFIKLSDSYQKRVTLLLFFPMVFTAVCTQEMCAISQDLNIYTDLNSSVYGISGDNPFAQEAWAIEKNINVPLLSDYDHEVAKSYGIAYESFLRDHNLGMKGVAKRSAFIIDRSGIIQYAESHDDPKNIPDFENIKVVLARLK